MNTSLALTSAALILTLSACAAQKPSLINYTCDNGQGLATQVLSEEHFAVQYQGKVHTMTRKLAASGVRYEGEGYQWWEKGNEGTLTPTGGPALTCRTAPRS